MLSKIIFFIFFSAGVASEENESCVKLASLVASQALEGTQNLEEISGIFKENLHVSKMVFSNFGNLLEKIGSFDLLKESGIELIGEQDRELEINKLVESFFAGDYRSPQKLIESLSGFSKRSATSEAVFCHEDSDIFFAHVEFFKRIQDEYIATANTRDGNTQKEIEAAFKEIEASLKLLNHEVEQLYSDQFDFICNCIQNSNFKGYLHTEMQTLVESEDANLVLEDKIEENSKNVVLLTNFLVTLHFDDDKTQEIVAKNTEIIFSDLCERLLSRAAIHFDEKAQQLAANMIDLYYSKAILRNNDFYRIKIIELAAKFASELQVHPGSMEGFVTASYLSKDEDDFTEAKTVADRLLQFEFLASAIIERFFQKTKSSTYVKLALHLKDIFSINLSHLRALRIFDSLYGKEYLYTLNLDQKSSPESFELYQSSRQNFLSKLLSAVNAFIAKTNASEDTSKFALAFDAFLDSELGHLIEEEYYVHFKFLNAMIISNLSEKISHSFAFKKTSGAKSCHLWTLLLEKDLAFAAEKISALLSKGVASSDEIRSLFKEVEGEKTEQIKFLSYTPEYTFARKQVFEIKRRDYSKMTPAEVEFLKEKMKGENQEFEAIVILEENGDKVNEADGKLVSIASDQKESNAETPSNKLSQPERLPSESAASQEDQSKVSKSKFSQIGGSESAKTSEASTQTDSFTSAPKPGHFGSAELAGSKVARITLTSGTLEAYEKLILEENIDSILKVDNGDSYFVEGDEYVDLVVYVQTSKPDSDCQKTLLISQ